MDFRQKKPASKYVFWGGEKPDDVDWDSRDDFSSTYLSNDTNSLYDNIDKDVLSNWLGLPHKIVNYGEPFDPEFGEIVNVNYNNNGTLTIEFNQLAITDSLLNDLFSPSNMQTWRNNLHLKIQSIMKMVALQQMIIKILSLEFKLQKILITQEINISIK